MPQPHTGKTSPCGTDSPLLPTVIGGTQDSKHPHWEKQGVFTHFLQPYFPPDEVTHTSTEVKTPACIFQGMKGRGEHSSTPTRGAWKLRHFRIGGWCSGIADVAETEILALHWPVLGAEGVQSSFPYLHMEDEVVTVVNHLLNAQYQHCSRRVKLYPFLLNVQQQQQSMVPFPYNWFIFMKGPPHPSSFAPGS